MLFNSLIFLIFLMLIVSIFYILPYKTRWYLLLIASFIFYMAWRVEFIFLILFFSIFNYGIGAYIEKYNKKYILILGILVNFSMLIFFKYTLFLNDSFKHISEYLGFTYPTYKFDIILPMGISFYTFQATSYIIDVYRKKYKAVKNPLKLTLYIMFFPQLVAGPIERADRLLGQLFKEHKFDMKNISLGVKIMIIGYFKKIVIADRVAMLVDGVYNSPYDYKGLPLFIATILFVVQIYCDFSGYSDIAVGSARLFGIDLMQNFKSPYLSRNIKEFWSRWHISLSTWFRDYLYIPLGGNRNGIAKTYLNILITFTVSGIWHGANLTFIIWGALNGIYQIIGDIKNKMGIKIKFAPLNILITFALISFGFIFFRANNIDDALYIIKNLFTDIHKITNIDYLYSIFTGFEINIFEMILVFINIFILFIIELFEKNERIYIKLEKSNFIIRFIFYYILLMIILCMGVFSDAGQFIYFQF